MTARALVLIGAVDWQHPAWRGRLYPDDLPDDWLLSYYNTRFTAVFLPAAVWQAASEATWAHWLYDTRDEFHFVLEPAESSPRIPESARVLAATPAWQAEHVWWLDEAPDLRLLAQRITRQAASGEPLFVFSRSGNIDLLEQVDTLRQVMGY
ncbi:MAG: hypothetical protein Q8R61_07385 [Thiobacillus sp.]|uniref:hypothetical protein n=1 Tax=Thiobacillus sp. TaxID=924 RepID=UPI0027356EFC|nr:hypothetical protein [Thiobacillus sp.]MDP3584930.1 hypothetical protein [Thiobacillus sp.]